VAEERVEPLLDFLRNLEQVERVEAAGSYRRKKETVWVIWTFLPSAMRAKR
jgi:DNA polymerase/3'-5' exonuclease PolX